MSINFKRVWITGDAHGDFDWLFGFCEEENTNQKEDLLIILGDSGIMYYGQEREREQNLKMIIQKL